MAGDEGTAVETPNVDNKIVEDKLAVAEEEQVEWAEEEYLPIVSNAMGDFDGSRFYLRSFPVWYRWAPWQRQQRFLQFSQERPETGSVDGVEFDQTMGRISLWYELRGDDANLTEEDFVVELSLWEMRVSIGRDVPPGKPGPRKVAALCKDLARDIRRKFSYWRIADNEDWPGRWLVINLAKLEHKPWKGPFFMTCLNPHRKSTFGWTPYHISQKIAKMLNVDDDTLARLPPGEPEETEKGLCTGITPDRLCTGIEDDEGELGENEDDHRISVLVHLDEETLELATGMVPMEEIFGAEVSFDSLDVFLRYDGLPIASGLLVGHVVPELTSWEITNVRRRKKTLPSSIKAPAYFNPALRITLIKAPGHQHRWGHAFSSLEAVQFQQPKERMSWTERVQRALLLCPAAPMKVTAKTERAQKLCTHIECSQDMVMNKAFILMHLEERLEEMALRYRFDISTFFSMKIGENMVEVNVVADTEFRMCIGALGGKCVPDKTSYEITREKNSNDDNEHLALKIGLTKAPDSREKWDEVFTRWEPWQVTEDLHKSLAEEEGAPQQVTDPSAKEGVEAE